MDVICLLVAVGLWAALAALVLACMEPAERAGVGKPAPGPAAKAGVAAGVGVRA